MDPLTLRLLYARHVGPLAPGGDLHPLSPEEAARAFRPLETPRGVLYVPRKSKMGPLGAARAFEERVVLEYLAEHGLRFLGRRPTGRGTLLLFHRERHLLTVGLKRYARPHVKADLWVAFDRLRGSLRFQDLLAWWRDRRGGLSPALARWVEEHHLHLHPEVPGPLGEEAPPRLP